MPTAKSAVPDQTVTLFFSAFRSLKQKMGLDNPLFRLPTAQMEALHLVGERGRTQMKEVADQLAIRPPSATVLINHLARSGLVKRQSDANDRRTIHLSLTKKGAKVLEQGMKQRCKIFKNLLNNLSAREQSALLKIFKKMVREN